MFGLPFAFTSPWLLLALFSLPVIWWLLRLTPPRPQEETFPPTRILARLQKQEETPAQSPWWLTLLRLAMTALVILAMAGPVLNPDETGVDSDGPVMIVMDDGWASAKDWETRRNTALSIIEDAKESGLPVMLISSTGHTGWNGLPISAEEANGLINAAEASPLIAAHGTVAKQINERIAANRPGQIHWLSNGLLHSRTATLVDNLSKSKIPTLYYKADTNGLVVIGALDNEPANLIGTAVRADVETPSRFDVTARDDENIVIARATAEFAADEFEAEFTFDQPVEIRNQISRVLIENAQNAGAVKLLDENNRRRLVGLVSGETYDQSQPLLSPLYYISKALQPFSDIRRSADASTEGAVTDLINQGVSVIVLADVGILTEKTSKALEKWITGGGMLVRFAGPRMSASPDRNLLPVEIRPGDRNLGGALSWDTPKRLAPFDTKSPFSGIELPLDVLIDRQLLALQETNLEEKTWSTLEDGTPLVTAEKRGAGHIVLFHVGSDANWSNLPLSGAFVEMLRRTVNISISNSLANSSDDKIVLPPFKMLDGKGRFSAPGEDTKPLVIEKSALPEVQKENPPGLYGSEEGFRALNLFKKGATLELLEHTNLIGEFEKRSYASDGEFEFRSWLLLAAAILLLLDCVAVLWMSGALKVRSSFPRSLSGSLAVVLAANLFSSLFLVGEPLAQQTDENGFDYSAALQTRLAYVITGVEDVDAISEAGMRGLTRYITTRTALEPGEPVGLNIATDALSFYSLLYWPVDPPQRFPTPSLWPG